MTRDVPMYPATTYRARERQDAPHRAFRNEVMAHVRSKGQLVDVRSPRRQRGAAAHAELPERRRAARRPHPWREEHPVAARSMPATARSRRRTSCGRSTSRSTL